MRIALLLLALFLSTPIQAVTLAEIFQPEKAAEEKFSAQINQWADSKLQEVLSQHEDLLLIKIKELFESFGIIDPRLSKASLVYEKMGAMNNLMLSDFANNPNDMAKTRGAYDFVKVFLTSFRETQAAIKPLIRKHANDFDEAVVQEQQTSLRNYCTTHEILLTNCSANFVGSTILMGRLLNAQPRHLEWLEREISILSEFADKVAKHGLEFETALYLKRAASSGCKNLSSFGNNLAAEINDMNFRPDSSALYDLGYFRVFQSQKDGVLLTTTFTNRGNFNSPLIFAVTKKQYTDEYIFQPGELYACLSGTKEYISVTGAKRRVLSFRTIQDSNTYLFIDNSLNEQRQVEPKH